MLNLALQGAAKLGKAEVAELSQLVATLQQWGNGLGRWIQPSADGLLGIAAGNSVTLTPSDKVAAVSYTLVNGRMGLNFVFSGVILTTTTAPTALLLTLPDGYRAIGRAYAGKGTIINGGTTYDALLTIPREGRILTITNYTAALVTDTACQVMGQILLEVTK